MKSLLHSLFVLFLAFCLMLPAGFVAFAEELEVSDDAANEQVLDDQEFEEQSLDDQEFEEQNDDESFTDENPDSTAGDVQVPLMMISPLTAASLAMDSITPGVYIITCSINSNMAFDIPGASLDPMIPVQLWSDNSSPAQRFMLVQNSDGSYTIKNIKSGLVLDVRGAAAANGTMVWQYPFNGTDAQKWILTRSTDGSNTFRISSKINQRYCLDIPGASSVHGAKLQIYEDNGTAAQRFYLNKIDGPVPDGVYIIGSSASNKVVDILGGSSENRAPAQLYDYNGTLAQRFLFTFDDQTGYYTIMNVKAAKVIDVLGAGSSNGTTVQSFEPNGTYAQKWAIVEVSAGKFRLTAAHSGLVFAVSGSSSTNGTRIQTFTWNNTASQLWTLTTSQAFDNGVYQVKSVLGTVLDAYGNGQANGTRIWAYSPNTTSAQKFYLKQVGNEFYILECLNSGRALSIESVSSARVILYDNSGSDNQLWKLSYAGEGRFFLVNKATGKVLDVLGANAASGTDVQIYPLNKTKAQQWSFETTDPLPNGLYIASSALDSRMVLDIRGNSTENGAKLQLHELNGTPAQIFEFTKVSSQYYRITCINSNKALDVYGASINPSTGHGIVQLYSAFGDNNTAQLWKIEYTGSGCFRIISAAGNQTSCLDVTGSSAANGVDVDVRRINNQANQAFRLIPAGSTLYFPLSISLDQMIQYQRTGNSYINSINDQQLRDVIDPSLTINDYLFPGHPSTYRYGIYQFADLRSYTDLSAGQLNSIIESTASGRSGMLRGQGAAFVTAAQTYGLNECYLLAHAVLESGWGTSQLAKGFDYNGTDLINGLTYPAGTYYNFYGIGAFDSSPLDSGRAYAVRNGWDSPEKAIIGGAKWISDNYIYASSYAQPTLYAMKWDYSRSNVTYAYGWHQYATDHLWARKIARSMGEFYAMLGVSPALYYIIPQYR